MIIIFKFKKTEKDNTEKQSDQVKDINKDTEKEISSSISECESLVKELFHNSSDLIIQVFETQKEKAMIVYIDGLTNKDITDRDIITPLKSSEFDGDITSAIKANYKIIDNISDFSNEVLQGNTAIFYGNTKKIYIVDLKQWDKRNVETPDSESVTRGPREGFTESIRSNTALLRRKIKTPDLIIENMFLGRQTKTAVAVAYIDGIVNRDVLEELKNRLSKIDTDSILESGYIEQYLDKNTFSSISGIGNTQKPDVAAARILEGRVAVFCDGTPHILTVPQLFIEIIQTSEDYYIRTILATILRIIRFIGLFITIILPGLAVAVITFNQEMMPSIFLATLIASTQKIPLPAGAEIFILILMFELLKEAGTRLPKAVGSAITIVGALVIGEAAVNAGIVSAPAVIIVALTAVTGFLVPSLTEFIIIYRYLFLFFGSLMGLIGIGSGIILMLTQIVSIESFGIPIFSSFSKNEMKDTIFRFPLFAMKYRPKSIAKNNIKRRNN